MPAQTQTRQLPKLSTRAAFVPATLNEEARTIELTWSTGAQVRRTDYWDETTWIEELSLDPAHVNLDRLNLGAPLLANHSNWSLTDVLGVVEKAWIQDGEGRALVKFSEREEILPIIADVKGGILRNISVGYTINKLERQPAMKDGLPVYLATDWEPMELSLVTIPADPGAQVRSEGKTNLVTIINKGDTAMPGQVEDKPNGTRGNAPAAPVTVESRIDESAIRADAAKNERVRVAEIRRFGQMSRIDEAVVNDLVERGVDLDAAKAAMLKSWSEKVDAETTRSDASVTTDEREKFVQAGVNAIMGRAGVDKMDGGNQFRGMRLTEIAKLCLDRAGVSVIGMDERDMVRRSFTTSTSDFPVLLEEAIHKTLLGAYKIAPDTFSRFCAIGSVTDFRAHNRYRLGSFGNLDALNENSEFKNKSIPDGEKSSITAGTKGNIINVSRQIIINDDLGAFIGLAQMFGRAGRRTIEADVYALLASNPTMPDGVALFHAAHDNLAGSGAVVSVAAIDAARVAMSKQLDISGEDFLDLTPALWLGPKSFGGTARVVNDAQYDPDTPNKLQMPNRVRGLFRDIIDTPRIAGNEWYTFADPNEAPVIEVAFLNGEQEPFLESEQGFDVDGMRLKVRLDYGVAAVDYRGAYKNPGAAS
ncbi:MAG: prohead protease/major capsid protein fusion protein [Methylobacter sp.]